MRRSSCSIAISSRQAGSSERCRTGCRSRFSIPSKDWMKIKSGVSITAISLIRRAERAVAKGVRMGNKQHDPDKERVFVRALQGAYSLNDELGRLRAMTRL